MLGVRLQGHIRCRAIYVVGDATVIGCHLTRSYSETPEAGHIFRGRGANILDDPSTNRGSGIQKERVSIFAPLLTTICGIYGVQVITRPVALWYQIPRKGFMGLGDWWYWLFWGICIFRRSRYRFMTLHLFTINNVYSTYEVPW